MTSTPTNSRAAAEAPRALEVAEALWTRAAEAGGRLRGGHDAEALHGFRVAIRRLRTCLESYPEFQSGDGLRLRKKLARVMRKTNAWRDLDVHQAICRAQIAESDLTPTQLQGFTEVGARLDEARASEARDAAAAVVARFAKLRQRAAALTPNPDAGGAEDETPSLPDATRPVVRRLVRQLRDDLDAITDATLEEAMHRARLTVKRLRYVTEPLKRTVDEVPSLLSEVKELQARLGDLRDLQTLDRRIRTMDDPTPAMVAAADIVRDELARRFRQLKDRWLEPDSPAILERAEAVVTRLS